MAEGFMKALGLDTFIVYLQEQKNTIIHNQWH